MIASIESGEAGAGGSKLKGEPKSLATLKFKTALHVDGRKGGSSWIEEEEKEDD